MPGTLTSSLRHTHYASWILHNDIEHSKSHIHDESWKYSPQHREGTLDLLCGQYQLRQRNKVGQLVPFNGKSLFTSFVNNLQSHHKRGTAGRESVFKGDFSEYNTAWLARVKQNALSLVADEGLPLYNSDSTANANEDIEFQPARLPDRAEASEPEVPPSSLAPSPIASDDSSLETLPLKDRTRLATESVASSSIHGRPPIKISLRKGTQRSTPTPVAAVAAEQDDVECDIDWNARLLWITSEVKSSVHTFFSNIKPATTQESHHVVGLYPELTACFESCFGDDWQTTTMTLERQKASTDSDVLRALIMSAIYEALLREGVDWQVELCWKLEFPNNAEFRETLEKLSDPDTNEQGRKESDVIIAKMITDSNLATQAVVEYHAEELAARILHTLDPHLSMVVSIAALRSLAPTKVAECEWKPAFQFGLKEIILSAMKLKADLTKTQTVHLFSWPKHKADFEDGTKVVYALMPGLSISGEICCAAQVVTMPESV